MTTHEVLTRLQSVARNGEGWKAKCPAHEDPAPSLSIREGIDGRTLLNCHAGCSAEAIVAATGLTLNDLFAAPTNNHAPRRVVATCVYHSADGTPVYRKVQTEPKNFFLESPDGRGGWKAGTNGAAPILYRLPEVQKAVAAGQTVFVVEGEKDVETLVARGYCGTCNRDDASKDTQKTKWRDTDAAPLVGAAEIVVVADKDDSGRAHAQAVARSFAGKVESLRIVECPDVNGRPVKDATNFFEAGGTPGQFAELVDLAPEWTPAQARPKPQEQPHEGTRHVRQCRHSRSMAR